MSMPPKEQRGGHNGKKSASQPEGLWFTPWPCWGLYICVTFFPAKVHSASHHFEISKAAARCAHACLSFWSPRVNWSLLCAFEQYSTGSKVFFDSILNRYQASWLVQDMLAWRNGVLLVESLYLSRKCLTLWRIFCTAWLPRYAPFLSLSSWNISQMPHKCPGGPGSYSKNIIIFFHQ